MLYNFASSLIPHNSNHQFRYTAYTYMAEVKLLQQTVSGSNFYLIIFLFISNRNGTSTTNTKIGQHFVIHGTEKYYCNFSFGGNFCLFRQARFKNSNVAVICTKGIFRRHHNFQLFDIKKDKRRLISVKIKKSINGETGVRPWGLREQTSSSDIKI